MAVLICLIIAFVISSGIQAFCGKALMETFKNCGKEAYLEVRTLWSKK